MRRNDVLLPDFTRLIWSSDAARTTWESRISQIGQYYHDREKETCKQGRSSIQILDPARLPELVTWATSNGLAVSTLSVDSRVNGYRSTPAGYTPGQPWDLKVVISPIDKVKNFLDAWRDSDHREIGNRLGFPPCCTRFFQRYWIEEKFVDTSWLMALDSDPMDVGGYDECNILLRWAGVRAVPHLPCSFSCIHTKLFARWFNDPSREEYEWIMEMLSWPVEWSALHGIARIKTPLFEISSRTDHTDELYVIRRKGKAYPKDGARGLVFPFRSEPEQEASLWKDNGFSSFASMNNAHTEILKEIPVDLDVDSVHDLGCGNGILLDLVGKRLARDVALFGVDQKEVKWRSSGTRILSSISDYTSDCHPSLALISSQRFIEDIRNLNTARKFDHVLIYNYEDWTFRLRRGNDAS